MEPDPEIIYDSGIQPDPTSARDVLAFVLTPLSAFRCVDAGDEAAAQEILTAAKQAAIERYFAAQRKPYCKSRM